MRREILDDRTVRYVNSLTLVGAMRGSDGATSGCVDHSKRKGQNKDKVIGDDVSLYRVQSGGRGEGEANRAVT